MNHETWLPVSGFPGYEVSDMGQVRSFKGLGRPRLLRQGLTKKGYPMVSLRANNRSCSKNVHQLIMLAFIGPRPEGMQVCHGDGNPSNNRLDNLRYDTVSGNFEDMMTQRLIKRWFPGLTPINPTKEQSL